MVLLIKNRSLFFSIFSRAGEKKIINILKGILIFGQVKNLREKNEIGKANLKTSFLAV